MKFARFLVRSLSSDSPSFLPDSTFKLTFSPPFLATLQQDNLTPEWRRAYIDYKGLKKILKKINPQPSAFSNEQVDSDGSSRGGDDDPSPRHPLTAAESLAKQVRKSLEREGEPIVEEREGEEAGDEQEEEEEEPRSEESSMGRRTHHLSSDGVGKGYGSMESTPPWNSVLNGTHPPPPDMIVDSPVSRLPTPTDLDSTQPPPVQRLTPSTALLSHLKPPASTTSTPSLPTSYISPPPLPAPPLPVLPSLNEESDALTTPLSPNPPLSHSKPRKSPRFFLPNKPSSSSKVNSSPAQRSSSSSSRRQPPSPRLVLPSAFLSSPNDSSSPQTPSGRARGQSFSLKGDPAGAILGMEGAGGPPRTGVLALIGTRQRTGSCEFQVASDLFFRFLM